MEKLYYYTLDGATGEKTGPMDHWAYLERETEHNDNALTGVITLRSDTVAPGVLVRTMFTGRTVNPGKPFECQITGLPLEEKRTAGCFQSQGEALAQHQRTVRELEDYFERAAGRP